jgi:uncharacterized membrane protein YqaE (UPF0057 family)
VADRDIAVKFTGDSSDLERASDKAESALKGSGKSMASSIGLMVDPASLAKDALSSVVGAVGDMVSAAAEDEAAAAQLAQQLRQAAGASDEAVAGAEDYITALSGVVGVADDELRPALATLATATGDTTKAQNLLALATDISAGSGKDMATVSDALAKASMGNTKGLKALGIATTDASGNALTLEQSLDDATAKFNDAGYAATQTAAGGLKKAGIAFDEIKEGIGAKLLPILASVGTFLVEKVVPGFETLVAWAEDQWPKVMEAIQPTLTQLQETFQTVLAVIIDLWNEWSDELFTIIGFVLNLWKNYLALEIQVLGEIIRRVIGGLQAFWAEWGTTITATVVTIVETVRNLATTIVEVATTIVTTLQEFWTAHGAQIMEFVNAVIDLVTALADRVTAIVRPLVAFLIDFIGTGLRIIFTIIGFVLGIIQALWAQWGDTIMAGVRIAFGIIADVIGGVLSVVVGIIKTVTSIIKGDWSGAWDNVKDTVQRGINFVVDLMGKIGGLVTAALVGLADLITKPFKIAFNAIADLWNNTIGALSFTFPEWIPGLGGNRIDVPDIPRFSTFGALTIVMPPGSDGYDVARQVSSFSRNVAPMGALTVAVR